MRSDEESIEMLKKRMRHQVNPSLEKDIVRQNIQYYVSSTMLQKEEERREEELGVRFHTPQMAEEKPRENAKLPEKEKEPLPTREDEPLPVDVKHMQKPGGVSSMAEYEKISEIAEMSETLETIEAQQLRGKNEYERLRRSIEFGESVDEKGFYYLNEKW